MNKRLLKMTDEKFQEIYRNKKLRNEVAYAHACHTSHETGAKFKHKKTCSYPIEYIVTEEQIKLAKEELERSSRATIAVNKGNLLFTGMGVVRDLGNGVTNHRFRANFETVRGTKAFIEFSYVDTKENPDCLHIDFAFLGDDCNKHRCDFEGNMIPKSIDLVLEMINQNFQTDFKKIIIENYDNVIDSISKSS